MKKVPNILSTFRLILAPVFLVLFIQEQIFWRGLSLVIFIIAAATDFIDGYIARRFNAESEYGVFLDPLADKFLTFAGFVCLPFLNLEQFPWWAILIIVIRDIAITSLRVFAKKKGITLETRKTAKAKTALQMIFLYIALFFGFLMLIGGEFGDVVTKIIESGVFFWGLMFVVAVTLFSGIEYLLVNRQIFKKIDG